MTADAHPVHRVGIVGAIWHFLDGELRSRTSLEIRDYLKRHGFWFVDARLWPALRRMERDGLITRTTRPGGPERGFRDVHSFAIDPWPRALRLVRLP